MLAAKILNNLMEEVIEEINQEKNFYKNFDILKKCDFNKKDKSGLLVLKSKEYPFVVKIFMENPKTFVKPFSKGFEPCYFFIMGSGANRFLSGFTRIKNLEAIKRKLSEKPEWSKLTDTPRKWFWTPSNVRWFTIEGENMSDKNELLKTSFPSTYAMVSDHIDSKKDFSLLNSSNRRMVLKLSQILGNRIDPHITNYIIEKGSRKLVIIDSEHFPTMVGLKKPLVFNNYRTWYRKLIFKCIKDYLFRDKQMRLKAQYDPDPEYLPV